MSTNDFSFILSRPHERIVATGADERFQHVDAAVAALRTGTAHFIVGALPFDPASPARLIAPRSFVREAAPWRPSSHAAHFGQLRVRAYEPAPAEHAARVARAVERIRSGQLDKVVLARRLLLESTTTFDPVAVFDNLVRRDNASNGYLADLTADSESGPVLVGSSPEILVSRTGDMVRCRPLAGSRPRTGHPSTDRSAADVLFSSGKDRREHAFVVESVRSKLAAVCSEVHTSEPFVTSTPTMFHLGTEVTAKLRNPQLTALDLAQHLHPTPAVCGTPTDAARQAIAEIEGDRGYYAGAVGWCDTNGDGEWMVTIRCAEITADRRGVVAYAGGGIVADSDPAMELAETTAKFGTILDALGGLATEAQVA